MYTDISKNTLKIKKKCFKNNFETHTQNNKIYNYLSFYSCS